MKIFRKKGVQQMVEWTPLSQMDGVSISESDKLNGSPKEGDMIAINPTDTSDMWLVAKQYVADNYEELL